MKNYTMSYRKKLHIQEVKISVPLGEITHTVGEKNTAACCVSIVQASSLKNNNKIVSVLGVAYRF
mgnify:CR=1 FL=1